ncbi:hypothetical protein B0A48_13694 [Cryoendolithus antarcticus]|uniref:Cellular morphogenesis protein n=1 Tax=Cryoendolithus antarcticus TaxID=1507870 RepID=A0A1V8SME6_9PEZI|nr:hypothetical protein B0A48_13694 [Cryoendolithus antarcticus]
MRNIVAQLFALGPELALFILSSPIFFARTVSAVTQQQVPSPNLDLSQLGRVALAGDFDSISLYEYVGQGQDSFSTNGSQSLLTRYPNGAFQTLGTTDAYIETMCPFVQNGKLQGVVMGGNFTRLGGVEAQGIALYDPNTTSITALPGLSGRVSALYCDDTSGTVYVGGSFSAGNSTNAMAWVTGWSNLPFEGFNGPVSSIVKNAAGNIVFGGSFEGLGNATTPKDPDVQVINLSSGNITSSGTSTRNGFSDPEQIICKTGAQDGAGNTWLLQDDTQGYWQGAYSFGFNPTKIRLYNTQQDGRGTKTFYFEDMNSGGILNLDYSDADGKSRSCSARCPLAQNSTSQDFHFVPPVGMNTFRIQIVDWYGPGGGLAGIELFQDDIYSFAVNDFNEPKCDGVSSGSSSTITPANGTWTRTANNGDTSSDYLTAVINDTTTDTGASVTFSPNLAQSGNYSIMVYTPGCLQDSSCASRGRVNLTGTMTSNAPPISTVVYQTNDYDKFDQIYYGYVNTDSGSFRPSVTLTPVAGQTNVTVVAQRVRFELVKSTGGLNGLYEFNPNLATVNTDFTTSAIDVAGHSLQSNAVVNAVAMYQDRLYVAGNFSGQGISNVMSVGSNATSLPGGGLNSEVQSIYQNGSTLWMGGNFTNTEDGKVQGLNSVAAFNVDTQSWAPLGAGVNGPVFDLVPLDVNITDGTLESCITVNGAFTSVNGFGDYDTLNTSGFAVWVPSRNNWLHNLPNVTIALSGKLVTATEVPGFSPLFAGQISAQKLGLSDAVQLVGSGQPGLQTLGLKIQPATASTSTKRKRAETGTADASGVYTGLYYGESNLNITVLGGSFIAEATNGSTVSNLIFINNTASTQAITGVTGLEPESIIVAMDTVNTLLFAGGSVQGTVNNAQVNGLVVVDLVTGEYASTQPPALAGGAVLVGAIATQPQTSTVYVGGNFQTAGSLPCETLCYYDTSAKQWNTPGSGLSGTINTMTWTSATDLMIAGNLTVSGNHTTMATYNTKTQAFAQYTSDTTLPGTISSLSPADSSYTTWWAAGLSTADNTAYLARHANNAWTFVDVLGPGTFIRGLQILSTTANHGSSDLLPADRVLLLSGNINIPSFGNASAALFNGTALTPFLLTSKTSGSGGGGSIAGLFVSNPSALMSGGGSHLALGLVVLIGLGISLFLIFLLVVIGILIERRRRKREGYVPMSMDRGKGNLERVPPQELFEGLHEKEGSGMQKL